MATYTKSTGYDLKVIAGTTNNSGVAVYTVPTGKYAWIEMVDAAAGYTLEVRTTRTQPGGGTSTALRASISSTAQLEHVGYFGQVTDFGDTTPPTAMANRFRLLGAGEALNLRSSTATGDYVAYVLEASPQV